MNTPHPTWTKADAAALAALEERRSEALTPLVLALQSALATPYAAACKLAERVAAEAPTLAPLLQSMIPAPSEPPQPTTPGFTPQELGTVLAALRYWQDGPAKGKGVSVALFEVATDDGKMEPLDSDGIDALCERLNFGTEALPYTAGQYRSVMIELDDYLRAIRSEELDGSEPELEALLERSRALWAGELDAS